MLRRTEFKFRELIGRNDIDNCHCAENFLFLFSSLSSKSKIFSGIPYQVTIYTSDVEGNALNGKIFLRLHGQDGETSQKVILPGDNLDEIENNFHRGAADVFIRKV